MIHAHDTPDSLKVCNSLLTGRERKEITRAAKFADAGRHMAAETIRMRLGYAREHCQADVDKVSA